MIKKYLMKDLKTTENFFFEIDKCPLVTDYPMHNHDFYELVVILSGKAIHIIEDEEYPIEAGHIFIINGEKSHGYRDVDGLRYFNVKFCNEKTEYHYACI